jgi:hypothetical protein
MVADFMSANYGWLTSSDGKQSTRVLPASLKEADLEKNVLTALDSVLSI